MACWYCPSAKQLRRLRVSSCSRQRGRLENAPVEHALHDGHQPRVRLGRVGVGLAAQLHVLVDGLGCAAVRRREQGWPALRGRQRAHRAAWSQTPTPPSRRTARRRPARTSARRSARPGGKTPAKATPLGFEAGTPATRRPRTLDASSDASWRSAKPSSSANASMRLMADDTSAQCWSTTFSSPLSACTCNSGSDSVKQASRPPAPAAWATINAPGEREKLGERRRFAPVRQLRSTRNASCSYRHAYGRSHGQRCAAALAADAFELGASREPRSRAPQFATCLAAVLGVCTAAAEEAAVGADARRVAARRARGSGSRGGTGGTAPQAWQRFAASRARR